MHTKYLLWLAVIAAVFMVMYWAGVFGDETIQNVEIVYAAGATRMADEHDIISACGLTGKKIEDVEQLRQEASKALSAKSGYFYVESAELTGSSSIKLTIGTRQAIAAVNYGGGYILLDAEGVMLEQCEKTYDTSNLIKLGNISLNKPQLGSQVVLTDVTDNRLSDMLEIAGVILENGYVSVFVGVDASQAGNGEYIIRASTSDHITPVYMNVKSGDSVLYVLDVAYELLQCNKINGIIRVYGDYAYFEPDSEEATAAKCM